MPNAKMLLSSLRSVGYTEETAIADIVDNSISSGANTIQLYFDWDDQTILIADNGKGMQKKELLDSMKIGSSDPGVTRSASDLGRFGMGMKTASFSLGKQLLVISKQKDEINNAEWNLEYVENEDKWEILIHSDEKIDTYIKSKTDKIEFQNWDEGTLISLSMLDKLIDENNMQKSKATLPVSIEESVIQIAYLAIEKSVAVYNSRGVYNRRNTGNNTSLKYVWEQRKNSSGNYMFYLNKKHPMLIKLMQELNEETKKELKTYLSLIENYSPSMLSGVIATTNSTEINDEVKSRDLLAVKEKIMVLKELGYEQEEIYEVFKEAPEYTYLGDEINKFI